MLTRLSRRAYSSSVSVAECKNLGSAVTYRNIYIHALALKTTRLYSTKVTFKDSYNNSHSLNSVDQFESRDEGKTTPIRVVVAGVSGWTGSALAQGIANDPSLVLVAGVSRKHAGSLVPNTNVPIVATVKEALSLKPDVLVDYTQPSSVKQHIFESIESNVSVIVGTSGLNANDYDDIQQRVKNSSIGVIASGNFSLTASLLKQFSIMAAKYIDTYEVIDYASFDKVDAPSGTAIELAETLSTISKPRIGVEIEDMHGAKDARGTNVKGVQVHSIRLPSYIIACESLFGLPDERLTIRHDAGSSAAPYVAGTILAIKKVQEKRGQVVRGLNTLLFGDT
jgi:4-hydroxy-tetrahydrodipicolinate reductase